ncbi:gliding motility lipoprotein GldD [Flavobacterium rhizosphaerae]|uniref:Gliding motility lipoprotein GldD n=1 Tax=Flavobacterium rhizosphaerae TaxID=3163298 RepID=A0ABW8YW94_9FLAO
MTVKKVTIKYLLITITVLTLVACGNESTPKPEAYLRLDYPMGTYQLFKNDCPYSFAYNSLSKVEEKEGCNLDIVYPKMKATIYMTYKPVNNNLEKLLRDAEKLTYEHVIKADEIHTQPYINRDKKVYGMFSQVGGNAATNAQFYLTDSVHHFVTGSLYFYAKPNFDSIMPAASYIKEDMRNIIETLKWK